MHRPALIISPGVSTRGGAWGNEVRNYSEVLEGDVFTLGDISSWSMKEGRYTIFKRSWLGFLLFLARLVKEHRNYHLTFIEQSPRTRMGTIFIMLILLRLLEPGKCAWRLTMAWLDMSNIQRAMFGYILPRLRLVMAMDKETQAYIEGKTHHNIALFATGINTGQFRELASPSARRFTFLFASAPFESKYFANKGVCILLEAFRDLSVRYGNIDLVLIMRGSQDNAGALLSGYAADHIKIVNRFITDMTEYYRDSHATIFVPTDLEMSRHYPLAVMESIACGRPVVVSNILEIASIVERENCGKVCEPTATSVAHAMEACMKN